jgi:hypothetical protein
MGSPPRGIPPVVEPKGPLGMAFCDFCSCELCQNGAPGVDHAQTDHGTWICSTCYTWDVCTSGHDRNLYGPCELPDGSLDPNCLHRPKLITGWSSG